MSSTGIDYGLGRTNIDRSNGIRYRCVSVRAVSEASYEEAEADYGKPHCPKCQREADEPAAFGDTFKDGRPDDYTDERYESDDYVCVDCKHFFGSESAFGEALGYSLDEGEYSAVDCLDSDILITRSPYYAYGPFCSPCVPGGVTLYDDVDRAAGYGPGNGIKAYCFGHDWFDGGKAPYKVYRVTDDSEVVPE